MDLFGGDRERILPIYKQEVVLLSNVENSTGCSDGNFENVYFHESDFTEWLEPEGKIVVVESNWGRLIKPDYIDPSIRVKSNRGRKPKIKTKKNRKIQGNGLKFNSCIQFTIAALSATGQPKKYKIKVFRNGKFQIPGVLTEDMSDILQPLEDLRKFLDGYFLDPVTIYGLKSVMRNYKFALIDGKIDIRAFYQYCIDRFTNLSNISMDDLVRFMLYPIIGTDSNYTPLYHPHDFQSWSDLMEAYGNDDLPPIETFKIDLEEMVGTLIHSSTVNKNTLVDFNKLRAWVSAYDPHKIYHKFMLYMRQIQNSYIKLSENTMRKILEMLLVKNLAALKILITSDSDNQLSGIKYDTEKYSGLLIYVKTPTQANPQKQTTVKIFPSGKINIDGANHIVEAQDIFWWINHILVQNPHFIYSNNYVHNETDDEFSESE